MVHPLFWVVAIQRQVRAFSLEGRSSKPLHSNNHDEESNSSSQDPQSSIFEKDLKTEPPNKANKWQRLGKSATTRAQSWSFGEKISLTCLWLKPMPNSFLPMQRKKIERLRYAPFFFFTQAVIYRRDPWDEFQKMTLIALPQKSFFKEIWMLFCHRKRNWVGGYSFIA